MITAVIMIMISATAIMLLGSRLRLIGKLPADERGSVKMYWQSFQGNAPDAYHNGGEYFLYDRGIHLATIRTGYDESLSIARVTEDEILLVRDSALIPFHQGFIYTVSRNNGSVAAWGEQGTYWDVELDDYLVFSDQDATHPTVSLVKLQSFGSVQDLTFEIGTNYQVQQVERSPDGNSIVVAARKTTSQGGMVYGSLFSLHLPSGRATELSQLSREASDGLDPAFADIIVGWDGDNVVNIVLGSTTASYAIE